MDIKGQLSIGFIVKLIIGIAVLAMILVFVTGKFRQGSEAISAASPQERDLAISTCENACSRAGLASESGGCGSWQNIFCNALVTMDGQQYSCHKDDGLDGFEINCPVSDDCPANPCSAYPSPTHKAALAEQESS